MVELLVIFICVLAAVAAGFSLADSVILARHTLIGLLREHALANRGFVPMPDPSSVRLRSVGDTRAARRMMRARSAGVSRGTQPLQRALGAV